MKNFFKLGVTALLAASCATGSPVGTEVQEGPYTITTIAKNIYHLQDCNDSNPSGETFAEDGSKAHFNNCSDMYLLVGKEKALLVDLSNYIRWYENPEEALRQIVADRIGDLPLEITFTHNHGDHTGMLPAFLGQDVKFLAPRTDFERLVPRFKEADVELIDEGYQFDLGGIKISTLLVPGHTAGSAVFFVEGQNILLSGDAIGSGHGVWIFNTDGYKNYVKAVPHLIDYINNPANGIDKSKLKIYGGHYWQKDWFPELGDDVFGMEYIDQMQELINQIADGSVKTEPSGLDHNTLDTYFRNGNAIIAWNAEQAEAYRNSL